MRVGRDAGVDQGFIQRLVGVSVVDILPDHRDRDRAVLRLHIAVNDVLPLAEISFLRLDAELLADDIVEVLLMQNQRHFVNRLRVVHRDHVIHRDIGEEGNLRALVFRNRAVRAAEEHVRIHALFTQLLHRVLGRLRLQFAGARDVGAEREMHEAGVIAADAEGELTDRFNERQALDIAHRAADFDHRHIGVAVKRITDAAEDELLDLVRDMRNHLHGLAEVLAVAFLVEHGLVDLAGREVIRLMHLRGDEALVVAEVKVGFRAVFRHKNFAVLERGHRTRIHVDVRIKLDHRHLESTGFQDGSEGSRSDSLAERRNNTASHKNEFGHRALTKR